MHRRLVPRNDPRYKQLRKQNNTSVKRSREKSRRELDETVESINELEQNNQQLIQSLQILKQEYEQLQGLFKQHTGIDIDQMTSSGAESISELSIPKQSPPKPVISINTTEEKSSSNNELDANNLDGSIVLINGVQYKIVSMNKN